jgi:hypothetical protein
MQEYLTYADVCRLTEDSEVTADVCWRMLTYADVCKLTEDSEFDNGSYADVCYAVC